MNGLLSDEELLRQFNEAESGQQPWYARALPMEGRATLLPFKDSMPGSVFNKREWAIPGLLAEAINAFTAPSRALLDPQFDTGKEGVNFALNVMGGGVGSSRSMVNPTGRGGIDLALNAWHGTPHNIQGKFDISKVGTGEGAQAYGHGIYFAENPNVAKEYQKMLAGPEKAAADYLKMYKTPDNAISVLQDSITPNLTPEAKKFALDAIDVLKSGKELKGNLYKVDIPDEQIPKMLDWDKPLNQQSQAVKDGLAKLGITADEKAYKSYLDDLEAQLMGGEAKGVKYVPMPLGQDIYRKLTARFGSDAAASRELNKVGIPGIRYLDEGSRGVEQKWVANLKDFGSYDFPSLKEAQDFIKSNPQYKFELIEPKPITSNFVSFQPETVKMLEKNGINIEDLLEQGLLGN